MKEGITNKSLKLDELFFEQFLASQQGSFNHRHKGLSVRLKKR